MTDRTIDGPAATLTRLWPWLVLAGLFGVGRTLVFVTHPTISFDADQAVIGLMAKHIAEGRAWPVHQYALTYVVELTAYLVAPFVWVLGPTIVALRVPMLLMNVAVGAMLVAAVIRAGVRPVQATIVALPVLLAPPGTSSALMDALGMTIEPLGFVLALWWLRQRPVAFGVVAALGFRVREFVVYGVAALVLAELLAGRLLTRDGLRHWALAAVGAAGAFACVDALARFETPFGPGTWVEANDNRPDSLSGAFCFAPAWASRNLIDMGARYLGQLLGATPMALELAVVRSGVSQGAPGLWLLFGLMLLTLVARIALGWRALWERRERAGVGLGTFLAAVGAQALVVYAVSRCGPISLLTLRYALLGLFLPTGLAVLFLQVERRPMARGVMCGLFILLAAVSVRDHGRLLIEQARTPHLANRVLLADALRRDGVRYAYSDYWTAYYVAFWTQEQILVVPDTLSRIAYYEHEVDAHADEAVRISAAPCGDAPEVAPGYHVCDARP